MRNDRFENFNKERGHPSPYDRQPQALGEQGRGGRQMDGLLAQLELRLRPLDYHSATTPARE
jgi:hypothetical protein